MLPIQKPTSNPNALRCRLFVGLMLGLASGFGMNVAQAQRPFAPAAEQPVRLKPVTARRALLPSDLRAREFERLSRDVDALDAQLGIVKRVVRLVSPSVVHIEARPLREYRTRSDSQEAGSGVVVRFGGGDYVLTNRHVIRHSAASHIRVRLDDGRSAKPTHVWSDKETDIAIMAIDSASLGELTPAVLGNSDHLEIGEYVLAFGSPFGLSQSVTRGILSAKGRYNLDLGDGDVRFQNFLQTDAAINPGNSGGPLVNLRGEVIGLNTAIASNSGGNEGIGFSIPINIATRISRQLITGGKPMRGFLGVSLDIAFNERKATEVGLPRLVGARVTGIEQNSPAETASLRENDVILRFDGVRVEDDEHLINLVNLTETGRRIELELFREGGMMRTVVQIGRK